MSRPADCPFGCLPLPWPAQKVRLQQGAKALALAHPEGAVCKHPAFVTPGFVVYGVGDFPDAGASIDVARGGL